MTVSFHEVDAATMFDLARHLMIAHNGEIQDFKFAPFKVNEPLYCQLHDCGLLKCYVAKDGEDCIGYATYFVDAHPHFNGAIVAKHDTFYISPDNRVGFTGTKFMTFAESKLQDAGAKAIFFTTTLKHDLDSLLRRKGYSPIERTYVKEL